MAKREIKLAQWVYETFEKYQNVALPNECMEMDREKLTNHFAKMFKCRVRIRECEMKSYDKNTFKVCVHKYLIAETL